MELRREHVKFFSKNYGQVKVLYETSFPAYERLPFLPLVVNSWRKLATFYAYYDEEEFIGLAYIIADDNVFFILFLAVATQLRSQGYGSRILTDLSDLAGDRPMILTIEPMDEAADNYAQRLRRLSFYEHNGFHLTNHYYQEGAESYQIMVTDKSLDLKAFEKLMKQVFLGLLRVKLT